MIDVLTNILESIAMEVNWLLANSTEMAAGDAAAVEFFPRSDAAALPTLSVAVTPREISNSLEARGVIRSEVVVDLSFAKKIDSSDGIKTLSKVVETVFAGLAYGRLKGFPDASCIAAERGLFNYDAAVAQRVFAATVTLTYSFFYRRKD
ncbi:MAG: hypothetical protein IKE64_11245 [Thermoguttaceae bacterium]|nr:hypothetical protein [Thermoguttaceae bacterium]